MIKKLITLGLFSVSVFSFAQQTEAKTQSRFTIIPSVGYAWRTAETASGLSKEEKDYIKGLKSGMNFDISAYYQVNKILSVGLKYSNYSASSDGYILGYVNGMPVSVPVTTKDQINFYGPAVMISNFTEATKHKLFVDMGLGVISYTTKTADVKGTGTNLGAEINVGYQYEVTKNILIGPKLGLTAGTLNKMKMNGVTYEFGEDQKEGLARVSLSAAASFRF
ncbi:MULTISPECIES: outer membrane beta-barrel protein [unclassified Chryseobacterium]|uniref:outer membrane beta-barrel protein n=1 Tax=unclassified Chryseobacterium TaxID=2593645 RepID=UPI00226A76E3|nr:MULTISPECIES: outer membrane beta-barrel protein [unclassified Chryseobacterium]